MEKAMTDSLERSLQNCSLNNNHTEKEEEKEEEEEDGDVLIVDNHHHHHVSNSDTTLDLNSHVSLPYHWEQCLDLKTGEIYYINWRNGMKAKEDPRSNNRNEESEEEEEESWDDSEESSSSESCCPSSSFNNNKEYHQNQNNNNNVLVVAGCKSCLMYFMVPKQVEDCPKCTGQLLHFDRSQTNDPTSPSP